MKDHLANLVAAAGSPAAARSVTREYLQARLLEGLQRAGAMVPLAFHGGTALRFLYAIPRYSEDLDFTLERTQADDSLERYLTIVRSGLAAEGYDLAVTLDQRQTVHGAWLRFRGLLHELGLSPHPNEVLAIRLEVDTHPPAGAGLATTIVRRHVVLNLQHHDRPSLLAGKLHAVLCRPYTKGRDLYDLMWYLADPTWPPPNLVLLNNALQQTDGGGPLDAATWRSAVAAKLETIDWTQVRSDLEPFIEQPGQADLVTREALLRLVAGKG